MSVHRFLVRNFSCAIIRVKSVRTNVINVTIVDLYARERPIIGTYGTVLSTFRRLSVNRQ